MKLLLAIVNELIILGILARIAVKYVNTADKNPLKWVITDVYDKNKLVILNDLILKVNNLLNYFIASIFLDLVPIIKILIMQIGNFYG